MRLGGGGAWIAARRTARRRRRLVATKLDAMRFDGEEEGSGGRSRKEMCQKISGDDEKVGMATTAGGEEDKLLSHTRPQSRTERCAIVRRQEESPKGRGENEERCWTLTLDLELAAHEGLLAVELAVSHVHEG